MGDKTGIQWTDATWNPTTGCDRVSPGCDNCYALTQAKRLKAMGQAKYQTDGDPRTSGPGFGLAIHPDTLGQPALWTRPRLIFVNSMSDLFHARVPLGFVRDVFDVIADTPQHRYQVLTKRSLRLARLADRLPWPPNLWMGVSVENATELRRVDHLRQVPASVRFLSCEPLLGPLDGLDLTGIGWCITGGESGRNARPMHPAWARQLRDQCVAAAVPFFFKQWGEWRPGGDPSRCADWIAGDGAFAIAGTPSATAMVRVGKHAAGRELDGWTWDQFPDSLTAVA
jgi:protein gp37